MQHASSPDVHNKRYPLLNVVTSLDSLSRATADSLLESLIPYSSRQAFLLCKNRSSANPFERLSRVSQDIVSSWARETPCVDIKTAIVAMIKNFTLFDNKYLIINICQEKP